MPFYKRLFNAGIAVYAVLCGLALLFYKERMVMPDDANYIFELVTNGGHFAIFHHRFIALLTQLLPFIAIKLDAALSTVTWLYSLNLMLFYTGCYLTAGFVFKNYKAALALLTSYVLFTTHTFYWAVPETGQGIALLFVAFAMLSNGSVRYNAFNIGLLGVLIFVAVCAHGLIIFVVAFMLLFHWLDQPAKRRWTLTAAVCFLIAFACKTLFLRDEYDQHALGGLRNFIRLFPNYFDTQSLRYFVRYCMGAYWWIPIIFAVNSLHYSLNKQWLKLALSTLFFLGYLTLTTIAFPEIQGNGFYNENLFLPLAVFLSIPLVYDVLPALNLKTFSAALLMLIAGSGLFRIWHNHQFYSARLAWQRSLVHKYEHQKVILGQRAFSKDTLLIGWSSPYELWLLSTIEQGQTASITITEDPARIAATAGADKRLFVPAFQSFSYSSLPPRYFKFQDTTSTYQIVR